MIQRIHDWLLERRIHSLATECALAMKAGDKDLARMLWNDQAEAIKSRSPAQVRRMERRLGIG